MEAFGIDPSQLPAAAVHITAHGADQRFAMDCSRGGDACGAKLTAERLQQFYEDVLWGRREELAGLDDGEDVGVDAHGGEL